MLGLEVQDVSFDRKTVTFRPNEHRRLKTRTSRRTVPLWPHLEEILRPYVFSTTAPRGGQGAESLTELLPVLFHPDQGPVGLDSPTALPCGGPS